MSMMSSESFCSQSSVSVGIWREAEGYIQEIKARHSHNLRHEIGECSLYSSGQTLFFFCSALKLQNTDPTSIDPVIVQFPYPVPVCKKRCYYYLKLCRWSPSKPWGWGRRNILHLSEWRNPWALVSSFHRGDQNQTKSWERDLQVVQ